MPNGPQLGSLATTRQESLRLSIASASATLPNGELCHTKHCPPEDHCPYTPTRSTFYPRRCTHFIFYFFSLTLVLGLVALSAFAFPLHLSIRFSFLLELVAHIVTGNLILFLYSFFAYIVHYLSLFPRSLPKGNQKSLGL